MQTSWGFTFQSPRDLSCVLMRILKYSVCVPVHACVEDMTTALYLICSLGTAGAHQVTEPAGELQGSSRLCLAVLGSQNSLLPHLASAVLALVYVCMWYAMASVYRSEDSPGS